MVLLVYEEHLDKTHRSPLGAKVLRKYYRHGAQSVLHVVYRARNWDIERQPLWVGLGRTLSRTLRFLTTVS